MFFTLRGKMRILYYSFGSFLNQGQAPKQIPPAMPLIAGWNGPAIQNGAIYNLDIYISNN